MLAALTAQLERGRDLSAEQVEGALPRLIDEHETVERKAGFLTALARKGETVDEIAAFARGLREFSLPPPVDALTRSRGILDVVGTGGDRLGTFNISTAAALVASAAGVVVAKSWDARDDRAEDCPVGRRIGAVVGRRVCILHEHLRQGGQRIGELLGELFTATDVRLLLILGEGGAGLEEKRTCQQHTGRKGPRSEHDEYRAAGKPERSTTRQSPVPQYALPRAPPRRAHRSLRCA